MQNASIIKGLCFVIIKFNDESADLIQHLASQEKTILIYEISEVCLKEDIQKLFLLMHKYKCAAPVILKRNFHESERDEILIKSAALLSVYFIDGYVNGLWLEDELNGDVRTMLDASFGILQSSRARISKTDYIACPSCGRTNFDLISTLKKVKSATSHLKGLKIGVMGCIVNGPGEMADADYGYVGSGKGKITLYKGKEIVKRGIPEENAVKELIELIKENGDWKDRVLL